MNLKTYEKTRYQNIYRHKKNKNYLVMVSKPVKTSISLYKGDKILKLEDALKVRDNPKTNTLKGTKNSQKQTFDVLWYNYINWCKNVDKQAFSTLTRKAKIYNKYLKGRYNRNITKLKEYDIVFYLESLKCSDKTKNDILKDVKAFFNWCVREKYLLFNPVNNTKNYKVDKPQMKFWTPEEIKKFFKTIDDEMEKGNNRETAYRTKIFALISFSLGDRTGETRALRFNSFDKKTNTVKIINSIDNDPENPTHIKTTKNTQSARVIDVSENLINEVEKYKWHLINEFDYDIIEDELIFCNHNTKRPLSDTTLRKYFYHYIELAKVTKIRMYDLRHTYVATMMMEDKELYHISQRIGHSSYSTTVDKYGHLSNKKRKEIAESTDKYI